MTTDELIKVLREWAAQMALPGRRELVKQAADRLEEQDEIIKQYQKADCFLAVHGWDWHRAINGWMEGLDA